MAYLSVLHHHPLEKINKSTTHIRIKKYGLTQKLMLIGLLDLTHFNLLCLLASTN